MNTLLDAAQEWLARGFYVVPVPFRLKGPIVESWQTLRLQPEDLPRYFNGNQQNIGVLLGEPYGNADADLDCTEANALWPTFAPETRLVFGRLSKPASHWFYRLDPPIPSKKYQDPIDSATIIELRCLSKDGDVGLQTVVPPSTHKDTGEQIRFETGMDGSPANVDADVLARAVAKTAAAAVLARHYPAAGQGRHDCELALAGALARARWEVDEAKEFMLATDRAIPDHDRNAIGRISTAVEDTFRKVAEGAEATGIPHLRELIDKKAVDAASGWLGVAARPTRESQEPLSDIRVNGRELRDVSADALAAIVAANDPPGMFSRAGLVVRIDKEENGRPIIVGITDVHLRGEMTRAADFHTLRKKKEEFVRTSVNPPRDVAQDILSRPVGELGFPPLEIITEAPFIRPDGAIVSKPGYDPITRTFYAPTGNLEGFSVPERPTADDVEGARALIEDALGEFPFVDQASRANAFAQFITPELRPAILGNVPMALDDAPQAGSGKTLLAAIISEKTSGSVAAMRPAPIRDDEEWRKLLTATIKAGHTLAIFDNVDHVLQSPSLALALTTGQWTDRILGRTEDVTLPQRTVFVATGNNIVLGGDMPRRCYWIRLDAQSPEPWLNREFRHPNLKGWVRSNRGRLLGAVLTLARAWFVAGCPRPSTPILGSFEEWSRIVGGTLEFAGVSGFLGNLDELYRQSDPTVAAWEAFLIELFKKMPRPGFTAADLAAGVRDDAELRLRLPEELGNLEDKGFQRRLGNALRKRLGRRYAESGIHLVRVDTRQGAVIWAVRADREDLIR